ncbi:CAP domain-containing protein [Streptomyces sp. H39-S7]|uniref:CAP domain-containing protein n=1 Tax=Streptomyces sp. H39-S7 TaxID=3004357 RepID=UPI0022AF2C33|nr:CAP domain-containing protein [Streptomyces sp. H39-S7]MCZ4125651.1 CAP domain-containing protein [Streptomyces sp. H39-S7]
MRHDPISTPQHAVGPFRRRRRPRSAAWAVASGLLAGAAVGTAGSHSAVASTPQPYAAITLAAANWRAQQVVGLVNVERLKHGCRRVAVNAKLTTAAQAHADDMAARGYYQHTTPDGTTPAARLSSAGYRWKRWGENIGKGSRNPQTVMDAWMRSASHRSNILNCAFREIGVGVSMRSNGPWWTQDFAAR